MKLWQKFSVIFFVSVPAIFFSPCVNAGGDYGSGETLPNENPITPPQDNPPVTNPNPNENPAAPPQNNPPVTNPNPNENPVAPPQDNPPITNPNPNENPAAPPQDNPPVNNENNFEPPVSSGVLGDINNDGELNALDLVVLQKYLKGDVFEVNEKAADINGDGTISLFDVHALLNLIKAEKKGTGDVNNDSKVNLYDVQTLTAYLANPQNTPINSSNADLNGDGRISTDDLKILRKVIATLQE